jgi:hypothetical protein
MKTILAFLALLSSASCLGTVALALDAPKGPVILTVKGKLSHPNAGEAAQFDLAMLEALPRRTATVKTPWTDGEPTFSGPLLQAVLEAAGAEGETLLVKALNDYFSAVPMSDARSIDTILATRLNGKPMSVREKGPLFLIYPFDLDPALYNEKYFSRSVWQIKEIEVRP